MASTLHTVCGHCSAVNRLDVERLPHVPRCGQCHQTLIPDTPQALTGEQLQLIRARDELPWVIDFWAPWCAPCRTMAPVLEAACRQFTPRARFGKLNTEQAPQASSAYGIRGIPTLVLLERGSERDRVTGAMTAQQLNQWLTQHLRTA